jgi:PLP dependent protein
VYTELAGVLVDESVEGRPHPANATESRGGVRFVVHRALAWADVGDDIDIAANLAAVRDRVARACAAAGRDPDEVAVLLATKTVPAERIAVAVAAGGRLTGENRVQELVEKADVLAGLPVERHFIGHLQTNKVNQALRHVSCLQTVDSLDLADKVQRRLEAIDATLDVFMQVNVSGEESKFGLEPGDVERFAADLAQRDRLRLRGLMTVGAPGPEQVAAPGYQLLRELRDRLRDAGHRAETLSMGMSGDLEVAVREGATMVRVGSAVFGSRPA